MGRKFIDITNKQYDGINVLSKHSSNSKGQILWKCECKCGEIIFSTATDLERGRRNYCYNCSEKKSRMSPIKSIFSAYKRNANIRNNEFNLSFEEFISLLFNKCYYCESPPMQILKKKGLKYEVIYNGIDRRNNELGYTLKNSVTCCKFCNLAKNRFSENEFLDWIKRIKNK